VIDYLEKTKEELYLRNYISKTVKSYLLCLNNYFHYTKYNTHDASDDSIKKFLLYFKDKNYSPQTINLHLNAIKFFYREVLKILQEINLKFAKRSKNYRLFYQEKQFCVNQCQDFAQKSSDFVQ